MECGSTLILRPLQWLFLLPWRLFPLDVPWRMSPPSGDLPCPAHPRRSFPFLCHLSRIPTLLSSSWHMSSCCMFYGFVVEISPSKHDFQEDCDSAVYCCFQANSSEPLDTKGIHLELSISYSFVFIVFIFKNTFHSWQVILFYICSSDIGSFKNKFKNVSKFKR